MASPASTPIHGNDLRWRRTWSNWDCSCRQNHDISSHEACPTSQERLHSINHTNSCILSLPPHQWETRHDTVHDPEVMGQNDQRKRWKAPGTHWRRKFEKNHHQIYFRAEESEVDLAPQIVLVLRLSNTHTQYAIEVENVLVYYSSRLLVLGYQDS